MDRIQEVEPEELSFGPGDIGDNLDDIYDNFDDYPSDLPLDFIEHPYIKDESPYDPEDTYTIELEPEEA